MECLSVHIFYHTEQNRLLSDGIRPLLMALEAEQLIHHYFYIRYWELGSHIRLRLFHEQKEPQIKRVIEQVLTQFFKDYPAEQLMSKYELEKHLSHLGKLEGVDAQHNHVADNNSYEYIPYVPEVERYGGPVGVALAESYFHLSSKICLELLSKNPGMNPKLLALEFMLASCQAFEYELEGIETFMFNYFNYWKRYQVIGHETDYSSLFMTNREKILTRINQVLSNPSPLIQQWKSMIHALYLKLKQHDQQDQLSVSKDALLMSYLHMHNNRLGVIPNNESDLAYWICQGLNQSWIEAA